MFKDIVGSKIIKKKLRETMIFPYQYPNLYKSKDKGILLYGPPGTGKTFIVKAAINELKAALPNVTIKFLAPTGAELKGKYVGETEKRIKAHFQCASREACKHEFELQKLADSGRKDENGNPYPYKRVICILFIDEIEAIAGKRTGEGGANMTNSVNTLLQQMDGVEPIPNVLVMGATNYPWKLDGAVLRRFKQRINMPLPTKMEIGGMILKNMVKHLEINANEFVTKYVPGENGEKGHFEPNDNGFFLMEVKKDDETGNEYYADEILNHCMHLRKKLEKAEENLVTNLPVQQKDSRQKRLEELEKELKENSKENKKD